MGPHRALSTVLKVVTCGNSVLRAFNHFPPADAGGQKDGVTDPWTAAKDGPPDLFNSETTFIPQSTPQFNSLLQDHFLSPGCSQAPFPQSTLREDAQDGKGSRMLQLQCVIQSHEPYCLEHYGGALLFRQF